MVIKTMICVGVLLSLAMLSDAQEFTCPTDETHVTLTGGEMVCPAGQVCNEQEIESAPGTIPPCIDASKRCPFTCSSTGSVIVAPGVDVECAEGLTCNPNPIRTCDMCVPVCFAPPVFTCDAADKSKVTINGIVAACQTGYECNEKNLPDCSPCIKSTTTNPPATTPTPPPTLVEPDCRNSLFSPCKKGNSQYYFKCVKQWNLQMKPVKRLCSSLYADLVCRSVSGICH